MLSESEASEGIWRAAWHTPGCFAALSMTRQGTLLMACHAVKKTITDVAF